MPNFIVRVELHNASSADYTNLHTAMSRAGFSRYIRGSNGITYPLPTAEYIVTSELTVEQVRDIAYRTASSVSASPGVIAARYTDAAWQGLR